MYNESTRWISSSINPFCRPSVLVVFIFHPVFSTREEWAEVLNAVIDSVVQSIVGRRHHIESSLVRDLCGVPCLSAVCD